MGADNTFKLKIVASNRVFYDGRAQTLVIPAVDGGEVGFLAQHENCVTPVEVGEMRIKDTQGKIIHAFVGSGFLEFVNNEATLVCVSAELPNEIDARRAKEAKERAEEEMPNGVPPLPGQPGSRHGASACRQALSQIIFLNIEASEYRSKGPVHTNRSFFVYKCKHRVYF